MHIFIFLYVTRLCHISLGVLRIIPSSHHYWCCYCYSNVVIVVFQTIPTRSYAIVSYTRVKFRANLLRRSVCVCVFLFLKVLFKILFVEYKIWLFLVLNFNTHDGGRVFFFFSIRPLQELLPVLGPL